MKRLVWWARDTEGASFGSRATKTENRVELADGGVGPSGRLSRACEIRDGMAAIPRRPARLGPPLDRIWRWCASRVCVSRRNHCRATKSQASGNHLPELHASFSFFSRLSVCGISGLAFGRQRLVRTAGDSDGQWVGDPLLSTDLCRTAGHPIQEARRLSVCCHSGVGRDCVRPVPLDEGVLATFCGMVGAISSLWAVLA